MDTDRRLFYVGTYTEGSSRGIYAFFLHRQTGSVEYLGLAAETHNPSYLAAHPDRPLLLAVNEQVPSSPSGTVTAFAIDRDSGALATINTVSSLGSAPCYVSIDETGNWAIVANYESGNVVLFPIRQDGSLGNATSIVETNGSGPVPERQDRPHAHCAVAAPGNRFAVVADLGADRIFTYRFDPVRGLLDVSGTSEVRSRPGAGPRHVQFARDGRHCFAINELDSTLTAYAFDARDGRLTPLQTVPTLPIGWSDPNTGAALHVSPCNRFLYASNRGHNSIAMMRVDPQSGSISIAGFAPTSGRTPRDFAIDRAGRFLIAACQDDHCLEAFGVDSRSGLLTSLGSFGDIGSPVCVTFAGWSTVS